MPWSRRTGFKTTLGRRNLRLSEKETFMMSENSWIDDSDLQVMRRFKEGIFIGYRRVSRICFLSDD